MSVFTDNELAYLRSQRLARLATVRPDGTPQIAPVGFRYNPDLDVIEIGGRYLSQTKKFRSLPKDGIKTIDGWAGIMEDVCAPADEVDQFNKRVRDPAGGVIHK